ncbi:MAG TPA: hypothetical protein VFE14_08245 [Micromonosporaceae bacterium]|jgi:hypothetical protein|nr:hypothetical protein [Micromonosporaceae bacterium]
MTQVLVSAIALAFTIAVPLGAVGFFHRYRLTRPAVGVMNGRDVAVMLGFVVALPFAYVALPPWVLPAVLGLVYAGALSIGYEPAVPRRWLRRALILGLLAADAVTAAAAAPFWFWAVNSLLVALVAGVVANLNVQAGLRLRHAAWFAAALAGYDLVFATVIPLTQRLAEAVDGYPFAPAAGLRIGAAGALVGLGDLLAYAMYAVAATKAYGRTGLRVALGAIAVFGALTPALAPLAIEAVTGHTPALIPAQVFFGPAAYAGYRMLRRRHGREHKMREAVPAQAAPA